MHIKILYSFNHYSNLGTSNGVTSTMTSTVTTGGKAYEDVSSVRHLTLLPHLSLKLFKQYSGVGKAGPRNTGDAENCIF